MNRITYLLVLFFLLQCATLQQIDKTRLENLLEYESLLNKSFHFDEIHLDDTQSNYINQIDTITIQYNGISMNENQELKESLYTYLESIKTNINKKNLKIIFTNENPLYILNFEVELSNVNQYRIIAVITRNQRNIKYSKEIGNVQILNYDSQNQKRILKSANNIQFLPALQSSILHFSSDFYENFESLLHQLGKGTVQISTIEPNDFVVLKDGKEIFKGKTPQRFSLFEGNYVLQIKKKGFPSKQIPFQVYENKEEKLVIRWEDESLSASLYLDSNEEFIIRFDGEIKGNNPVLMNELPKGDYQIEFLKEKQGDYLKIYDQDISVKENTILKLFYPVNLYQKLYKKNFFDAIQKRYWYASKTSDKFDIRIPENEFVSLKKNIKLFTPHYLLDNSICEVILECKICNIYFLFENYEKFLIKKIDNRIQVYSGSEPLKLEGIYLIKDDEMYLYFDSYFSEEFSIYLNTERILKKSFLSRYVQIIFENLHNDNDMKIREFYISSRDRKNRLSRILHFIQKNISKYYNKIYKIQ